VKTLKVHGLQAISSLACGLVLIASASPSVAQINATNYPDKPIKIIVPYTPGGGTDTVTWRLVERISADNPKWQFVVDNKAGGGGNIGLDLVAKARPNSLWQALAGTGTVGHLAGEPLSNALRQR
jgi:tripartite-type tricarboxylate transporter receptor subunit TctC